MNEATSPKPAASMEALNASKHGVRVEFFWSGDRFRHTIFGVRGEEAVPLLDSVEGTADEHFPPSPPFTELHQQDETIFLSGATSAGHWSMCVSKAQLESTLLDDSAASLSSQFNGHSEQWSLGNNSSTKSSDQYLMFDIACRIRKQFGSVRSEYNRISPEVRCWQTGSLACAASKGHGALISSFSEHHSSMFRVHCEGEQNDVSTLFIAPLAAKPTTFPTTIQWQYGVLSPFA